MEVARLHVRSWQIGYRALLPPAFLDTLRPEDRAARYTFGDPDPARPATTVAVCDGAIRGFVTTGPARDEGARGAGEILGLYVDPDLWRDGIGRALIREARGRLHRAGHREAILWVLDGNDRAARFYQADGWRPDGTFRREEVWGLLVGEHRYRRALP